MKVRLGNKWEVSWNSVPLSDYEGKIKDRPYTHYIGNKRLDMARNLWCFEVLLSHIYPVHKVVEYFGGIGAEAPFIRSILKPDIHKAYDIDQDCVSMYKHAFPNVDVSIGDFYVIAGITASVSILDFETYTIGKLNAKEFDALRRVFVASDIVILVDTAIGKYHLNWKAYENMLYRPARNIDEYFQAVSEYYHRNYGFVIDVVTSHTRASYMLMTENEQIPKIHHIRAEKDADTWFEVIDD